MKIPGNNHQVVLGIKSPAIPMIRVADNILKTAFVGAFVLVSLNTK